MARMVKKPIADLIIDNIWKLVNMLAAGLSRDESSLIMLCDILTNADDLTDKQKRYAQSRLQTIAYELTSNDCQRAKEYLLSMSIKVMS